jgi:hypothetical protein
MVDRRSEVWRVSRELAAEVLAVAGGGRIGEELVDNRQVVVERADRRESGGLGIAVVAAARGEDEGSGDDVERDALLMERSRKAAVGGPLFLFEQKRKVQKDRALFGVSGMLR